MSLNQFSIETLRDLEIPPILRNLQVAVLVEQRFS